MTPRQMLVWWLRGLRPTRRGVRASLLPPRPCLSLEALLLLPTVEPDYTRHVRPDAPNYAAAAWWLQTVWNQAWGHESDLYRECVAASLLGKRQMADARELMS